MPYLENLTKEHRECDQAFTLIERKAMQDDWDGASIALHEFVDSMNNHFSYEENELFPVLEEVNPMAAAGPIPVMLGEHMQMRELFADLGEAVAGKNLELLADAVQTLLFVMQQHNAKEENVLYPLADQALATHKMVMQA
jgi:hemerythrin-like domain-containing protein